MDRSRLEWLGRVNRTMISGAILSTWRHGWRVRGKQDVYRSVWWHCSAILRIMFPRRGLLDEAKLTHTCASAYSHTQTRCSHNIKVSSDIKIKMSYKTFEILTAVVIGSSVLWDITPCTLLKVIWRFGGTCSLHL
jgi:hypothetical protein